MQVQSINNGNTNFGAKIYIEKNSVLEVGGAIKNCELRGCLNKQLSKLRNYHGNDVIMLGAKYFDDSGVRVLCAKNCKTDVEMFENFPSDAEDKEKSNIVYRLLADLADTKLRWHDTFWGNDIYGKEEMPNVTEANTVKSPILHSIFY